MTVLGPVSPEELGPTYMHEHVIVDNSFSGNNPLKKLDEVDVLTWEMKDVLRAGGRTIVDCTCAGLGPDPAALRRIAQESGMQIVTSTGLYRSVVYPPDIDRVSADDLAARFIRDCEQGLGDTGVRPGMLAEFASHDPEDTDSQGHDPGGRVGKHTEKVFRAAARAHLATGLPITTHCWVGIGADWEIGIFREEGVDLSKVVIGHVGANRPDMDLARWILDQGVNVGIEAIGYGERDGFLGFYEHEKAQLVKTFIEWGHIGQITVSLDMTRKYHLKKYGGHGFAFLMDAFAPTLREVGLSDEEVNHILVKNPKRILTPSSR
ncbi:MAG: hypothetical protein V2A58_18605 [Planctomycetota bacterium]